MVMFQGLLESLSDGSLEQDPNIRMISLFDNEEVSVLYRLGSGSVRSFLCCKVIVCTVRWCCALL